MNSQNGNALWFILLAVALFGVLAAVISRSNSSVEQTGSIEKASIKASSLLRYGRSVQQSAQQMILNQGISENDLDFESIDADHDNTNCTSSDCNVFAQDGGGISYRTPGEVMSLSNFTGNWHISTSNIVNGFGCSTTNNRCTELLLILKDIPQSICMQINRLQKITTSSGDAPRIRTMTSGDEFDGTYTSSGINSDLIGGSDATNEAPEVEGKSAACVYEFGGSPESYVYYQVLLAR